LIAGVFGATTPGRPLADLCEPKTLSALMG